MDVSTDHARILNNPTSQIQLIPSNSRRGLASLVMVACWTIHNLIGSIYLLFTPSPATTTTPYLPRNTQHNRSRRNSAFTDAQTRLAHSAHRWQQNRQKFLWDRLQIDARRLCGCAQDYFTIKVCSVGKSDRRRNVTQGNSLRPSEWCFMWIFS